MSESPRTARPPRLPGASPMDDYPELPFDKDWGGTVKQARLDLELSQQELADAIGSDQPTISYIERGLLESSRAVRPLVEFLKIAPPKVFMGDDLDERWNEAGRILRRVDERHFRLLLNIAEQAVAEAGEPEPH